MKYLIIPDVHNRCDKVERIIESVKADKVIFLGDYFDDFYDDERIISHVAEWFRHSVHQPNRIHIVGNHDMHYWFSENKSLRCSGYEEAKSIAINKIVKKEDWEKLVFFHVLDDKWLLSHAGVHPSWIDKSSFKGNAINESTLPTVKRRLEAEVEQAKKAFYANKMHWFGMPGFSRSHSSPYFGGLTWCDWNDEFSPIRGVHQIVGHTPLYNLTWISVESGAQRYEILPAECIDNPTLTTDSSYNICLDSEPGSRYYAIYEEGKLSIIGT